MFLKPEEFYYEAHLRFPIDSGYDYTVGSPKRWLLTAPN
jgi:hypothetical protein